MKDKIYGLYIPPEILNNTEIDCVDKILLSEIITLHEKSKGCIASNDKFSRMLNISSGRVSKRITHLKDLGYLTITLKKKSNQTVERTIVPTEKVKVVNDHTPSRKRLSPLVVNDHTPSRKRLSPLVVNDQTDIHVGKHIEQHIEQHLEYQEINNLDYTDFESQQLLQNEPYLKKYKL